MRDDSYNEKELDVKLNWILIEIVNVFLVKIFTIICFFWGKNLI